MITRFGFSQAFITALAAGLGISHLWLLRLAQTEPLLVDTFVPAADSPLVVVALIVSGLTAPITVLAITVAGGIFALYEHQARLWWAAAGLGVGTILLTTVLKELIQLPRPEHGLVALSSYGFPSLHATLATVGLIVIAWLAHRLTSRISPWLVTATAAAGWLVICLSRLILGVHGASDVLAGILLGIAIGAAALTAGPRILNWSNAATRS